MWRLWMMTGAVSQRRCGRSGTKSFGLAAARRSRRSLPAPPRNAEERRLLWKLPNLSPTNHSKGQRSPPSPVGSALSASLQESGCVEDNVLIAESHVSVLIKTTGTSSAGRMDNAEFGSMALGPPRASGFVRFFKSPGPY